MIRTKPMDHQVRIQNFGVKRQCAAIFAEYGTGKTLAALMIANALRLKRVLVISTKLSVQSVWPTETRLHSNFRWVTLVGGRRKKARMLYHAMKTVHENVRYSSGKTVPTLFLVNYDGVKNIYREIIKCPWDAVILDESTKIKSPHTLRTKIIWDLGQRIKRRYIMTGFPITENIPDVYAQMKFLTNDNLLGTSYYAFLNTYFARMGTKILPKRNKIKELFEKIRPYCIYITNKSLKLPPKRYKRLDIELTSKQKELLAEFKATFRLEFGKVKIDTQYIFALITRSLEICDGYIKDNDGNIEAVPTNKDEALIEILEEVNAYRNKVVIWAAHRFSAKKIYRILTKLKYGVVTLTGETENPDLSVKRFQHDKRYTVMVASQKKAAESVTLTAAKYAIYYSNTWSNELRANSEARIRRKGSEHHESILYTDLVSQSDVEQRVYNCLRNKGDLITDLKKHFVAMDGK